MWTCHYLTLCALLSLCHGSAVVFQATPPEVKAGLSPSLSLRCSLTDTAPSSSIIGRRDVTRTQENVDDVTSLIVMRNGQELAIVTHKHPATAVNSSSAIQTTGATLSTGGGEQGYLEVKIPAPTYEETGEYTCEVNAVNSLGHNIQFSSTLEVQVTEPTMADLVSAIQSLRADNSALHTQMTSLRADNLALSSEVKAARHVEHGRLNCDWDASDWSGHEGQVIFDSQSAVFNQSYDKPPVVFLSIIVNDYVHGYDIFYWVELKSVTTTGFIMHCNNYRSDRHVWNLWVDWISVAT